MTQQALEEWAKEELNLEKAPNHSSISRIIKKAAKFAAIFPDANTATKCHRLEAVLRFEQTLFQRKSNKNNGGMALNDGIVKFHGTKLMDDTKALLPKNENIRTKSFNG